MASTPNLPQPQSYEQLLSDMLSAYAASIGINDFNVGSINTSFFEVVALTVARASGDIFQILRDFSVDRATGDALQRLAAEYNVQPISASPATGFVNIIDTSFTKISTQVYAGTNPPNIGSTVINVSDASDFPATGSVYLGRGTPNIEGPLAYGTAPIQTGSFWTITLSVPTAKYHNVGEPVILAQGGNRTVQANTIAVSPGVGTSSSIQYGTSAAATILDGETEVNGVPISALDPGANGNVPAGSITNFASPPFSGATVNNPLPLTNGSDNETDDQLRVRVKNALASQGLGTSTAVQASLRGATATLPSGQTNTIVGSSVQINTDGSATVYIDDGASIFEETSNGVGLEHIVDSALGGEQFFQLQTGGSQAPVAKAFLQTTLSAPYDIVGQDTLAVVVAGVTYQHVFQNSDFVSPGGATAFEITASINADTSLGFQATTANGGTSVVISAISETDDTIFVTVPSNGKPDASPLLGFPSNVIETLRLYKNNLPLSKDGATATVFTQTQQLWSTTIANGDTLVLSVDGTSPITYTITNADFINTGLYTSVGASNSLAAWIEVFNNKLTGVTASVSGTQIELTSNLGANNRAAVIISPSSTLVSKGMFSTATSLTAQGQASDFSLDRNTAQFKLAVPLVAGDTLSAGSEKTSASVSSAAIASGSVTLSANANFWVLIDTAGLLITTGVVSNSTLTVSKPSTNTIRYTSSVSGAFGNALPGDYVIIWSAELPASDRLEGRIHALTGTTLDVLVTASEYAAATATSVTFNQGFVVLRSELAPQRFEVTSGLLTLDQVVLQLQPQSENLVFAVSQEEFLTVTSTTLDSSGSVLVVTADAQAQFLLLPVGKFASSEPSLIASYDSRGYSGAFPLFFHSTFASDAIANPPDTFVTSVSSTLMPLSEQNTLVSILNPYGGIDDAQSAGEVVQTSNISGTALGLTKDVYLHRIRGNVDRYYLGSALDFGSKDTSVVIFDNNTANESFTIPFYRVALTNSTDVVNSFNFNAYDLAAGPTTNFDSTFGDFDFSNFKALMQAKHILKPTPTKTAILYRATQFGVSGQKITVAYTYPTAPSATIGSSVSVGISIPIIISLASGPVATNSIDATTQWNVTVTPTTPSATIDQVTFTWNGSGTNPAMTLSGGEYVNISPSSGFNAANTGIYRVSTQAGFAPTATAFTVQMPHGQAVAQTNIPTLINGSLQLYQVSPTTAAQIVAYVNANLSQYISATLANDGDFSGSGVIILSTFEDSGFTVNNVGLLDGINYIATSDVTSSPQFTFKNALAYPGDGPGNAWYAFNNGEQVTLVPSTIEQVNRFISILAVSGFTTFGSSNLVDRDSRLELATQTLGSAGALQIVGGSANQYSFPVLNAGALVQGSLSLMSISVNAVAAQAAHSGSWFRLQAANAQKKLSGFSSNTSITVVGADPIAGEATVSILGRTLTQRDFGKPRNHVRTMSDTFRIEKQGNLSCISWTGVGTNPIFVKSALNFNDSAGGTVNITPITGTSDVQYAIQTGNANFTELSIGDFIVVAGLSSAANNGTFIVTGVSDNGKTIQVTNPSAAATTGVTFVAGNFSATSGVAEGDTVILQAPFNVLNQGKFRVIREFNNSVWIENLDVLEEEVNLPYNPVSLGFDTTTSFQVNASNNTLFLIWTGVGTEPTLGNATMGDILTVGTSFSGANQGSFMVLDTSPKLQQISQITLPSGPQFTTGGVGSYFKMWNAGNVTNYYVWFNVNGGNSDPAPGGLTGIQVSILSGDTAISVAAKTALAITGAAGSFFTAVAPVSSNTVTITTSGFATTNATVNFNVPAPFSVATLQVGTRTYIEAINPGAASQSSITVTTGVLQAHRPQIQFWEYEAAVPGDFFVATGSILGSSNAGSYQILQVLNRDTAVVSGNLSSITNVSLNNNVTAAYVQEGTPYYGYKHVYLVSAQPGTTNLDLVLFDSNAQYQKINQSAGVAVTSLNKLDFSTALLNGLDSYRYNTGLISEANKIIYGDPRDSITYPGVGAAGADIFIKAPLALRIKVAIDVRLQTGAPFNTVAQQIRTNVAYLINSNAVGTPIDISSIVSTVRSVPGVSSVAISSPNYSPTTDLINVTPNQKAIIVDPSSDISVDQIG